METDLLIVGAGIAGASLAAAVAAERMTVLVEAEDMPGRHATGRSAAFYDESYGGPGIQPLTTAAGPMLRSPGEEMGGHSFLRPRGGLIIARNGDEALLDAMVADFAGTPVSLDPVSGACLSTMLPGLLPGWSSALAQPQCEDIDVAALHHANLALARRRGATLLTRSPFTGAVRRSDGRWQVQSGSLSLTASVIVNAAGAWADQVAGLAGAAPMGITPYRRTMVQLRLGRETPASLPLVIDARGEFYFKGEGVGRIWLSPHDETADFPHDVAAEEHDIALAIHRFQQVVDWPIAAVERRWAGLRSFAPDRLPVLGFAPDMPGFFWCAGQGGFGIQTAPSAALLAASLLLTRDPDPRISTIDATIYSPSRFA
ncbi:FAD-binding oxidoreductase [Sphingomonas lacunae]|uniref:FAD-binding oxidoreductase n=1 Tax=Sphingomonas lacunae TaxID=2698828 RepID=A0A6M4AW27_9SPHN|nr:FAD-dependent oxidoreductase [Sphingomonas lacunae]QJQ33328.1 FAD-binding oxidoreductase [Sphingomonas lacunae]